MPNNETQIRLQDLPGAIRPGLADLPIEQSEVAFSDEAKSKLGVIKEVKQNIALAEAHMQQRALRGVWDITEVMLRAEVKPEKWKGSDQLRSHLGIPILAEHFYSLLSTVQQTMFAGLRPFQIDPTSGTKMETAQAQEALIMSEIQTCGPKGGTLKQEVRSVIYDGFLYGTGAAIFGWETKKFKVIKRRRKNAPVVVPSGPSGAISIPQGDEDELEEYVEEREINRPVFEHIPIRRLRVAPDCRRSDVRTASWAARYIYPSSYDLDPLRETEGWNIPSREELTKLTTPVKLDGTEQNPMDYYGSAFPDFRVTNNNKAWPEFYDQKNNVDPLAGKWEVIDYWTATHHHVILEKQFLLYSEPHDFGIIPLVSFNFREAPDSFWGWGLGHWLGNFQRIASGVVNAFFDDLNLNLMGTYVRPAGLNTSAQADWVFPGKVFKSEPGANGQMFQQLQRNSTGIDVLAVIAQVKDWAASISGAGAGVQGSNPGKPGDMRTSAGVQMIGGGTQIKIQDIVDQLADLVFIPFLMFCVEQNRKLKPSQVRQMLSQELTQAWTGDPLDVINGDYKVSISAGSRLQARQALGQSLGFIVQLLQAPGMTQQLETQAKKVLYDKILKVVFETTGMPYYNDIIQDMTDEDKQRMAANSQAAMAQSKLGVIQAQTQSKIAAQENQAENRALLRAQERMYEEEDKSFLGTT